MQDVFVSTRAVAEPSGALALAGLKIWCIENKAKGLKLSAVLSGANLNFDRLRYVAERTALGEKNEALFFLNSSISRFLIILSYLAGSISSGFMNAIFFPSIFLSLIALIK